MTTEIEDSLLEYIKQCLPATGAFGAYIIFKDKICEILLIRHSYYISMNIEGLQRKLEGLFQNYSYEISDVTESGIEDYLLRAKINYLVTGQNIVHELNSCLTGGV